MLLLIPDIFRVFSVYSELGIGTLCNCENEQAEMLKLAQTMFDTKLPPGVTMLQPFSEGSSIKKISVEVQSFLNPHHDHKNIISPFSFLS